MSSRSHRPFEGLTWAQLCALRNVYTGYYKSCRRAIWALSKKKVPLIVGTLHHNHFTTYEITDEGLKVWVKMKNWRPDLFKEKAQ